MLVLQALYEYLAIISPPAPICTDVMAMKHLYEVDYKCHSATKSKPHITLANFIQPFSFDEKVVDRYMRLAATACPFKIHLSGFGHFSTHTIYVKLTDTEKICDIAKNIRLFTKAGLKRVPNYPPHIMREPHLTIAKGMVEKEFDKAWPTWQVKNYQAEFHARQILLLRRPFSDTRQNYEVIGNFPFTGSGILDAQLKMF